MRLRGDTMNRTLLIQAIFCLSFALGRVAPGYAGEPWVQLKQTTDKVLAVLADPSLKGSAKTAERRERIRRIVDERFDWEEMARRALARHWAPRTPEEKREFIPLFKEVLERVYADRVEGYSWNRILYEGEHIDGNYASIKVKIFTEKDQVIHVEYRTWKKGNDWLVYDFSVEGVGLVSNYRTQFNEIIAKSSYHELVKRLKTKSEQN
jgi:phospholipid transport system substrate-binding protein